MPRILLAEDHTLVRNGIRLLLERFDDMKIVAEAEDGRQAVELARKLLPDLAILDVGMPNLNGLNAASRIRAQCPPTRILMLSMHAEVQYVREAFRVGANGYVLKTAASEDLLTAIRELMRGKSYVSEPLRAALQNAQARARNRESPLELAALTARESEILQLIAEGNTGPEIARALGLSERTVETHRQNVMAKLDVHTIAGLTRMALRLGLTALEN